MQVDAQTNAHSPQPAAVQDYRRPGWLARNETWLILLAILALAAFFRFTGREFDQGTNQHPDERTVTSHTLRLRWPSDLSLLLDPLHSTMNLRAAGMEDNCPTTFCDYPYGSLPVYLTRAAGWLFDSFTPADSPRKGYFINDYYGVTVMGRHLSTVFDLITVLLVFLIARRLYSRGTALIAAALVAFAVTHIQLAHFSTVDTFLTTFMMGALYFSVVLMQRATWWAAAGVGACIGLAVASKVSVGPFALVVVAAVVLRALYRKRTRKLGAEFGDPIGVKPASAAERELSFRSHLARGIPLLLISGLFALLAFAATEPYVLWSFDYAQFSQGGINAVLNSNTWWRRILYEADIHAGKNDGVPYTRQYVGTVPLLFHLQNMVFWGLSPLPGLITVVGFAAGIWHAIRRKPAELLLMAGALPYFATIVTLEAKWMRYMLPLVPIFCMLGAAFLVRGIIWERNRRLRQQPRVVVARKPLMAPVLNNVFAIMTALAVGGAFLWAVAFMNIYSQEHSRIQASRWIYANVPDGARLSTEVWDDTLPLRASGVPGKNFTHVPYGLYDDNPPELEFNYIKGLLRDTDYIIEASNRLYGSIPRLPWRYPVQTRYYELLFEEKLGFIRVHTQLETPELLGMRFDDQLADESFTVYDHPRVDIFKKVTTLTDEQLRSLFSNALNRPLGEYQAVRHGKVSDDKSLTYEEFGPAIPYNKPVSALPDVGDYAWNPLAREETQWIAVLLWLLVAYTLGFLALPIVFTVCRNLPDRGYPMAKVVGLLLVSWGAWMAASAHVVPFTTWGVWLMVLLMAGLSYLCWRRGAEAEIVDFFRKKARLVLFYEAIFLLAFAAFLVIRILNPDTWHPWNGGEKPMEIGFLNSILRSAWMPPLDPFFAGGFINYYYYGHFVVACVIKLVGVDPAIAFNLAIPLLYALTMGGAVSLIYNLVAWSQRRRGSTRLVSEAGMVFGVLSGVLMLVIGNMHGFFQWVRLYSPPTWNGIYNSLAGMGVNVDALRGITGRETFDFWGPRSIIPFTINEWPFWTFLFADLHPHLINMPFTLLAAVFSLNLALSGRLSRSLFRDQEGGVSFESLRSGVMRSLEWLWGHGWAGALRFGLMALSLGVLFAINSWDFPTYMAIAGVAALVAMLVAGRDSRPVGSSRDRDLEARQPSRLAARDRWTLYLTGVASLAVLAAVALVAYIPFLLNFKAFYTEILPIVDGSSFMRRTSLPEFLVMWGIFVFIALSYLVVRLWQFPWGNVLKEVESLMPGRPRPSPLTPTAQQAFSIEAPLPRRSPELAAAFASSSGGALVVPTASMHFQTEQKESAEVGPGPDGAWNSTTGGSGVATDDGPDIEPEQRSDGHSDAGSVVEITADGRDDTAPADSRSHDQHTEDTQPNRILQPTGGDYKPGSWVIDAHSQAQVEVTARPGFEYPGLIPTWAGVGMLALTAFLTALQIATGQHLLALLVLLIGGITATTLASTRSPAVLFATLLLVGALVVAIGVELVYLADHLRGGESFRMNTVFKFYIQVWVLIAAGCAAAVYYMVYGLRDYVAPLRNATPSAMPLAATPLRAEAPRETTEHEETALAPTYDGSTTGEQARAEVEQADASATSNGSDMRQPVHDNWLVWATSEPARPDITVASSEGGEDRASVPDSGAQIPSTAMAPPALQAATPAFEADAPDVETREALTPSVRWNPAKLAWASLLGLFIMACLTYPLMGVPARVADRFPGKQPPVGTLDGMKYMMYGTFTTDAALFPIDLRYDYRAIQWMKENISGQKVIAEIPLGYYRELGMRAAANTGLSMVVGGLHQDEQRAAVYARLVGERNGEMNEFFRTVDVQRALTLMSKYDIDYIYVGQLEEARGGVGISKFEQMAAPEVGILKRVFNLKDETTQRGTTIYEVVKDARTIVGAPEEGSGIPGISITPLPTPSPTPFPTPPVDDPALKALIDEVIADPNNREKRFRLVEWYNQHGYPSDAARELSVLVTQDPQNVALRHQLGDAYQAMGQPDQALKAWEEGRDIDPNNPPGHNKVGIAYLERSRYDDAVREFQEATRLDPAFIEAWFHLGEAFEAKGDAGNAKNAYQNAIDRSTSPNSWADSARERLSRMR